MLKIKITLISWKKLIILIVFRLKQSKKSLLSIECEGAWRDALRKSNFNIVKKKLSDLVNIIKDESIYYHNIKVFLNMIIYLKNMIDR